MFKRLILIDFRQGNINIKTILNSIRKILQLILVFIVVLDLSNRLINKTEFNKGITLIIAANIVVIYGLHIIIHREFLLALKKDALMMFLREDAFNYVKAKFNILMIKYLIAVVIPTLLPYIILEESIFRKFMLIISSIILLYLLNMVCLYGVLFLKKKSEESLIIKVLFFIVSGILFIGFFSVLTIVSQIILTFFSERNMWYITNIVNKNNIFLVILTLLIILGGIYIALYNFMKNNTYILYEEERSKEKDNNKIGLKILRHNLIKDKRFARDIIVFFRDKPFLKIIGILIVFMQSMSMVAFYFTDVLSPSGLYEMINFSQYHFLVIFAISIMCYLINMIINLGQLKVDSELEMANQFALDINIKELIMEKAKGFFIISNLPIILGVILMIFLKHDEGSYVQYIYVLIPIIFLFKFISLSLVKILNCTGVFREIKIAYLIGVGIGIFVYCVYNLLGFFKIESGTTLEVHLLNILLIIITIALYYVEVVGLKKFKEWTKYDKHR